MRRLELIAGMVLLLAAVGSFAMQGSAQDSDVPVLQTQVADLQTRVAALEGTSVATPAAVSGEIVATVLASGAWRLTGTGQQMTEPFTSGDSTTMSFTFNCASYGGWIVLRNLDFNETQRIGDGETLVKVMPQNTYSVNVHCSDRWQLLMVFWQAQSSTSQSGPEDSGPYSFSGRGFDATDAVTLDATPYRASFTCAGNPLGFVTMYDANGIAEVIGDGDMIMQNDAGTYWFDITCDMAWSLTITPLGS